MYVRTYVRTYIRTYVRIYVKKVPEKSFQNVRKKRHDVKPCIKSRFRNVDPKAAWEMS